MRLSHPPTHTHPHTLPASLEMKKKLYGSVLLIGGGLAFSGAANLLQARLELKFPAMFGRGTDNIEVFSNPRVSRRRESRTCQDLISSVSLHSITLFPLLCSSIASLTLSPLLPPSPSPSPSPSTQDLDPALVAWRGGGVLKCLDTCQELWIEKQEWEFSGIRLLRERAPFQY